VGYDVVLLLKTGGAAAENNLLGSSAAGWRTVEGRIETGLSQLVDSYLFTWLSSSGLQHAVCFKTANVWHEDLASDV